ncbi:CRE-MGL-1 protein [Caenorhabditis remanei]|uniref:CRE-MGL-1 protein n=1 Tax=Caenorhabditis remanei TaxID=31234 RepID=E3MMQ8_CAERE|nr:CRE-MGL-1 protein [Caenorhabditis remanei]
MFSVLALATQILANVNVIAQTAETISLAPPAKVRQIRIPGDILIGGVFPVHSKSLNGDEPCGEIAETRGVHRVEAMLYALDQINSQNDFLRGYKLGALILDSCSNPAYALNQSLDFVRDMIGSSEASDYVCLDGSDPNVKKQSQKKNVAAVVGGSYSSVSVQLANLLRLFRIAQVSPASTNADLSDKNRFEYFARTVPSDDYQAMAMVEIAVRFKWSYVSLVYSADEYGELGADAFKKEARKKGICIALEERIQNKKESFTESINNLVQKLQPEKNVGATVVVLFVGTEYIPDILRYTAERMKLTSGAKKRIIWLASESWDRNNDKYTAGDNRLAAQGAIVLMLASQKVPSFEEYFMSLHPGTEAFERNKWLRELWQVKYKCEFDIPPGTKGTRCEDIKQSTEGFNADDKVQFVIDAVYAIAHGLQVLKHLFFITKSNFKSMKQAVCPDDAIENHWISRYSKQPEICHAMQNIDGSDFYQNYLLKVNFTGESFISIFFSHILLFEDIVGKRFRFSPQGDGPASYTILTYKPKTMEKKRRMTDDESSPSDYVEIGHWSENNLTIYEKNLWWDPDHTPVSLCSLPCKIGFRKQLIKDEQCCWACSKCEDYEYLINETHCVACEQGWWPTKDRKGCFDLSLSQLKYMRWRSMYSLVPMILAVVGIIATLFVIVVYVIYNETPVVKASGRELSYILLISMIMCYCMTFVLLSKPSAIVCAIKRTGIGFAFSCLYSAMFVKTNRIFRIFNTRSAQRPRFISPISQIFRVFSGWRHHYPTRDQVVLTCNVPDHHFLYSLAYDGFLIVLCTTYAVKTRKVPENFNETKFIGFSMYTTCVVWLSWIFFFFGTGSDFQVYAVPQNNDLQMFQIQTSSLCISISMSANVALACIFSPKLWIILFEKHKNVRKQEGEIMLNKSSRSLGNCSSRLCANSIDEPNQYTALLTDSTRRRSSRKTSQPTSTSSAQDTFL